ncbi:MAG: ATP-binding region ATPase domain protein [Frankiales bacterium]|nr:ATP-binding region ATPase domain protein [Frankiales bacterium]
MGILWVRHTPASAALVRASLLAALAGTAIAGDDAFDASLIASELIGNAIRHAPPLPSGHLMVEWHIDQTRYTISVTDGGVRPDLATRQPSAWEPSGRGLAIIDALADEWGVEPTEIGTRVWASRTVPANTEAVSRAAILTNH